MRLRLVALCLSGSLTLSGCAGHSRLLAPTPKDLAHVAPDSFLVELLTTRGRVVIAAHRDWSPLGVDRLHFLLEQRFYDGARFFRVVPGFVVQWGISGDSAVNAVWKRRELPDEPVRHSNARGKISYARGGPNTRTVQLYVNLVNNPRLDTLNTFGFPPLAEVIEGMAVMDSMFADYSCRRGSQGTCPSQDSIQTHGNAYLLRVYPNLDYIRRARITKVWR